MLNVANIAACHPNLPKLLMIKLLDPIEIPKTNNSRKIVSDVLFLFSVKLQVAQYISYTDTNKHNRYNSKHSNQFF